MSIDVTKTDNDKQERVSPVKVTKTDKDKQERVLWVKEAMADTMAATKEDLKNLTYEVNPFIKKVEEKTYWEYDIDKVKDYLYKLKDIKNFQDIANLSLEKKTGAYTVKWIMAVQIALKALWVAPGLTIDWVLATKGNFSGSATVQAIKKFQGDNKLDVTGVPYGRTIKMLLEQLGGAVSGTASESSPNNQDTNANDKTKPNALEQQKLSSDAENFIQDVVNQLENAENPKNDILAVKKALMNYLQGKDFSEFRIGDSTKIKNGKYYYDGVEGENSTSEIWTFANNVLVDWVKIIFSGESDKFQELRIVSKQGIETYPASPVSSEIAVNSAWVSQWNWKTQVQQKVKPLVWGIAPTAPQNPMNSAKIDIQKPTEWKQNEVPGKTDEELRKKVEDFFSKEDPKNPDTTIFDTLAHWNGRDFEKLGEILSKLSLDGLAGKTEALRELKTSLNNIVTILNQNETFRLFDGTQRKKALLKQIAGIMSKVWGIPEWELHKYQGLGALLQNKKTNTSQSVTPPLGGGAVPIEVYSEPPTSDKNDNDKVSVQVHKENEKGLTKDNVSYSDLMKALDLEKQDKSTNNPQNDTLLKSDTDGSKYFLIGGKKYYQIPAFTNDKNGNEVSPVLNKENYYEITKEGDLTVISFWPVDENGYITDPEFSLKSNGERSFKDTDDQGATKKTNKKNK